MKSLYNTNFNGIEYVYCLKWILFFMKFIARCFTETEIIIYSSGWWTGNGLRYNGTIVRYLRPVHELDVNNDGFMVAIDNA